MDFLDVTQNGPGRSTLENMVADATGRHVTWVRRWLGVVYQHSGQANDPSRPGDIYLGSHRLGRIDGWTVVLDDKRYCPTPRRFTVRKV